MTAEQQARVRVLPLARVARLSFGTAWPVALEADRAGLDVLADLIDTARAELDAVHPIEPPDGPGRQTTP